MADEDGQENEKPKRETMTRATGSTASERLLQRHCERSFLRFWSHPCVFRDEGVNKTGEGKEVCDLLVVFGNDILIFSDKEIEYSDHSDPHVAWSRWFRRAVMAGATQVYGAERWIKSYPKRLFLDRPCKQPFPFPLPAADKARIHRIVVAHGASKACRKHFGGGTGSLMIDTAVIGDAHVEKANPSHLFTVGQIDPSRGFVHVFDDATLSVVMSTLDTTADFVAYLNKKEAFITKPTHVIASGEEDLLAFYLQKLTPAREHDFVIPPEINSVLFPDELWTEFHIHPQRLAQIEANRVSYVWDKLIERFSHHIMSGTQYFSHGDGLQESEIPIRMLASENRTRRRVLADSLLHVINTANKTQRFTRVHKSLTPDEPAYVMLSLPYIYTNSEDEYRLVRRKMLESLCYIARAMMPEVQHVVGIAVTPTAEQGCSEDLMYLDATDWTDEQQTFAIEEQKQLGLLTNIKTIEGTFTEYPKVEALRVPAPTYDTKVGRNERCPCGSGKKFKKCCMP